MPENRTKKSIRNGTIALAFSIILLALGFFSRRVFIECLGIELLGLNTTATSILGFLNLAELGIGASISFALYGPLSRDAKCDINEIVAIQGWLYRRVSKTVLIGAIVIMAFFPIIFSEVDFPFWYVYASFGVYLLSALLGYWFNYQQIVLIADQNEYKVTWCVQGIRSAKILLQIICIGQFGFGYEFWIASEIIAAVVTTVVLKIVVRRTYSWLKPRIEDGKQLSLKYPEILKKTKQLVFHRVSEYIVQHISPLLVYAFVSLSMVAIYGNYMMLVMNITLLVSAVFNGSTASIGNLVAEGNKEKIIEFYKKYIFLRYWLASVVCFCFYNLSHDFISVWIGSQYVIDDATFGLMTIFAFIATTRLNDQFLAAYGLYQDIWAPITETILNIGLSVLFGIIWGIPGVVGGAVCGSFIIVCCWKPYFLFGQGFRQSIFKYLKLLLQISIIIGVSWCISHYLCDLLCAGRSTDFLSWLQRATITLFCYAIISFCIFVIMGKPFRNVLKFLR